MKKLLMFQEFVNESLNEENVKTLQLGSKGPEVSTLQQKLIDLKFLNIPTPTGIFGTKTDAAVRQFQSKNELKVDGVVGKDTYPKLMGSASKAPVNSISKSLLKPEPFVAKSDAFSMYAQKALNAKQSYELSQQTKKELAQAKISEEDYTTGHWYTKFIKAPMMALPLHIRAVLYYIAGRTGEMNEDELTQEEKNYLYSVAKQYGLKNGFKYGLWKKYGAANLPTAITRAGINAETQKLAKTGSEQLKDTVAPNIAGQFMYTLGEIDKVNVKQIAPESIEIKDNYDMNASDKSAGELISAVGNVFTDWTSGKAGLYSLIRTAISLRELTGYKGFPIRFKLTEPETTA